MNMISWNTHETREHEDELDLPPPPPMPKEHRHTRPLRRNPDWTETAPNEWYCTKHHFVWRDGRGCYACAEEKDAAALRGTSSFAEQVTNGLQHAPLTTNGVGYPHNDMHGGGGGGGGPLRKDEVRIPDPIDSPVFMSQSSEVRKLMPIATGCLKYFPDALLLVAWVSRVGNEKHNPGQPLHWAKEKSPDESDAEVRHMLDYFRGEPADPGLEPLGDLGHLASKAWRALAHLQRACDAARKAVK